MLNTTWIPINDEHLEAKLFAKLFPFGKGGYKINNPWFTLGEYVKFRVKHSDNRFRKILHV